MAGIRFEKEELEYFSTETEKRCYYKIFDCHGGVSSGSFASLNIGSYSGDDQQCVRENLRRVRTRMGVSTLLTARQVHGDRVYCLTTALEADREIKGVDALITDLTDVGLLIQQADCQAVLLFDPVREVIAAVHCGWRGSVQHILARTVLAMVEKYGSKPADLWAVISPSLGPCCAEFLNYRKELPEYFSRFMVSENHFNFWQITKHQLVCAGLVQSQIKITGICTCCSADYFSYRRAKRNNGGVTGRNCSVIAINHF